MGRHTPGWSFDNQYERNRKKGQEKAARGEGPWAQDAYLSELAKQRQRDWQANAEARAKDNEGCGKATLFLLGTLGGAAWFLAEAAGRII